MASKASRGLCSCRPFRYATTRLGIPAVPSDGIILEKTDYARVVQISNAV